MKEGPVTMPSDHEEAAHRAILNHPGMNGPCLVYDRRKGYTENGLKDKEERNRYLESFSSGLFPVVYSVCCGFGLCSLPLAQWI